MEKVITTVLDGLKLKSHCDAHVLTWTNHDLVFQRMIRDCSFLGFNFRTAVTEYFQPVLK